MATHQIKLINKATMFYIPDKVHLTEDNPGPVEIDVLALSPNEKQWINNAHRQHRLEVIPLPGYVPPQVPTVEKLSTPATPLKPVDVKALKEKAEQDRLRLVADASSTLKATVSALTRHVEKSSNIQKLKSMRDIEREGKKRAKVLEALDKRIGEIELAISTMSGPALTEKDVFVTARDLKNLPEIEEELEDTVTINLGE